MPAVEIADSIVQSGRETLEKVCGRYAPQPCYSRRSRNLGHCCHRLDGEMGWESRLRGYGFGVHIPQG